MRPAASLALAVLPCLAAPQAAQPEFELKARFLLQFPEFVSWPAPAEPQDPGRPFVILVLGESPFGDRLDAAAKGRKAQGRPVEIRYARDAAALDGCQMAFICASERGRLGALLARAESKAVLTVADTPGFGERGVMINLAVESDRSVFEINRGSARSAGLSLSAQLLGLARRVY